MLVQERAAIGRSDAERHRGRESPRLTSSILLRVLIFSSAEYYASSRRIPQHRQVLLQPINLGLADKHVEQHHSNRIERQIGERRDSCFESAVCAL